MKNDENLIEVLARGIEPDWMDATANGAFADVNEEVERWQRATREKAGDLLAALRAAGYGVFNLRMSAEPSAEARAWADDMMVKVAADEAERAATAERLAQAEAEVTRLNAYVVKLREAFAEHLAGDRCILGWATSPEGCDCAVCRAAALKETSHEE